MEHRSGPLYELTFSVQRESIADFERWLEAFCSAAVVEPGVIDCDKRATSDDDSAREIRTCQFHITDDRALDELLDGFFAETDTRITQEFGAGVFVAGRTLREDSRLDLPQVESPDCLNCGNRLRGQYCGICGQRARSRLISLWQLLSEAFGDLFELDSRLWRTLIPLVARPGRLTRDYLEGRRARYMPPFRMYLVLSLVFFVVAFFDPRDDLGLLFEPEPEPTPQALAEKDALATGARREILDELAAEGIIVVNRLPDDKLKSAVEHNEDTANEHTSESSNRTDDDSGACNIESANLSGLPVWFQKRFTPARLNRVCEKITADKGKAFLGLLRDNIPVALFVLLPLMALVLKILYPLSRRYFVEHLLFVIHYHAFFFLILTLEISFDRITALLRFPEFLVSLAIVAASFYIPVYLYKAMRHVYGQGRVMTFIKFIALLVAYSAGAMLTMLGAVFFALAAV